MDTTQMNFHQREEDRHSAPVDVRREKLRQYEKVWDTVTFRDNKVTRMSIRTGNASVSAVKTQIELTSIKEQLLRLQRRRANSRASQANGLISVRSNRPDAELRHREVNNTQIPVETREVNNHTILNTNHIRDSHQYENVSRQSGVELANTITRQVTHVTTSSNNSNDRSNKSIKLKSHPVTGHTRKSRELSNSSCSSDSSISTNSDSSDLDVRTKNHSKPKKKKHHNRRMKSVSTDSSSDDSESDDGSSSGDDYTKKHRQETSDRRHHINRPYERNIGQIMEEQLGLGLRL
ncbi:hypothetical protein PGB90_006578 [Kerria lacca]